MSILVVLGVAFAGRRTLTRTALNRGIVLSVLVALVLHDAVEICTWIMGVDMVTTHMISVCQWAAITGLGAVFLDRALLVPTLGFLVTLAVIIWTPAQRLWASSASLAVVLTVVVYVWKMQGRGRRIAGYLEILRPDA